jgi:hypothetical protein
VAEAKGMPSGEPEGDAQDEICSNGANETAMNILSTGVSR